MNTKDKVKSSRLQIQIIDLLRHENKELTALQIGSMLREDEILDDLYALEESQTIRWDKELKGWTLV